MAAGSGQRTKRLALLTCFDEKASSWPAARGKRGHPARALCSRSRKRCDRSGRAQRRGGLRCSAPHYTQPDIQAPGTRLYWGQASLLWRGKERMRHIVKIFPFWRKWAWRVADKTKAITVSWLKPFTLPAHAFTMNHNKRDNCSKTDCTLHFFVLTITRVLWFMDGVNNNCYWICSVLLLCK